jgi:hypothetical protein
MWNQLNPMILPDCCLTLFNDSLPEKHHLCDAVNAYVPIDWYKKHVVQTVIYQDIPLTINVTHSSKMKFADANERADTAY